MCPGSKREVSLLNFTNKTGKQNTSVRQRRESFVYARLLPVPACVIIATATSCFYLSRQAPELSMNMLQYEQHSADWPFLDIMALQTHSGICCVCVCMYVCVYLWLSEHQYVILGICIICFCLCDCVCVLRERCPALINYYFPLT